MIEADLKKMLRGNTKPIVFLCIGTDRSTGDSYGPLVGSRLKSLGYNVIGTIDDTCHALNLQKRLAEIPEGSLVIAVDAALGRASSIGKILVHPKPLKPGAGVGKDLPEVGDISIHGIVNVGGFMEYFTLQNTRLSTVLRLVDETVAAIQKAVPIPQKFHIPVLRLLKGVFSSARFKRPSLQRVRRLRPPRRPRRSARTSICDATAA